MLGREYSAMAPIANCLVRLGREAVSLDFPGFGESPEPPGPWGVPEYAACTRAFMEAIGIGGCDVVAHSFGGRVTIQLASETPELFHRLILVDAAGIKPSEAPNIIGGSIPISWGRSWPSPRL